MKRPKRRAEGSVYSDWEHIQQLEKYVDWLEQERDLTFTKMENDIQELKEALKEK